MARAILGIGGLALLVSILWASGEADLFVSFGNMIQDPWGLVALIDLYLGFIIFSVIVFALEKNKATAFLWILPLYFLGNIIAVAYLLLRGLGHLTPLKEGDA